MLLQFLYMFRVSFDLPLSNRESNRKYRYDIPGTFVTNLAEKRKRSHIHCDRSLWEK
ncbi:Uncharacterised protein [Chlamydia trachomatis]|nr:Uncharacterised protein [Chlamydia trachomatis]